jgi:DNA-binding MarR family transcriptional regulator
MLTACATARHITQANCAVCLLVLYSAAMTTEVDSSLLASDLRVVFGQLVRRLRAEHRFSLTHAAVLGRLDREGPLSTVELATAERVRPQSMSQILAELEAQELISRTPDATDGRRTLLALTFTGRSALAEDRQRREGWLSRALEDGFSPAERDLLGRAVQLLSRLTEM